MSLLLFWKEIVISQICSGSVSFIASLVIAFFLALSGLSNPYRRIIFGLSISDIFQSFGIVAGPFLNRTNVPQALWAIGNAHTCQFSGFIFMAGATAVPMYTLCLCIYYVCKLKGKMNDDQFGHRVEKKMHIIIILLNVGLYVPALVMGTINSGSFGNMCLAAAWPTGCRQNPKIFGECEPRIAQLSQVFNFIPNLLMPVVCLIGIIVCLAVIFWNVVVSERIFGRSSDGTTDQNEEVHASDADRNRHDSRAISQLYKRELVTQAFCYMTVFLLSTLPFLTINLILLAGSQPSRNHYRSSAILYPLGGFFNIIVYSRMNVEGFHRKHPECPRIQAFWLVLKAGGGMPSDEDWTESMAWKIYSCCPRHLSPDENKAQEDEKEVIVKDPRNHGEDGIEAITKDPRNHSQDDIEATTKDPRNHSQDSQTTLSLFPITHADIAKQLTVSDLHIMMRSRPYVSSSIPDSAQGVLQASEGVTINDLEGFSNIDGLQSKWFTTDNDLDDSSALHVSVEDGYSVKNSLSDVHSGNSSWNESKSQITDLDRNSPSTPIVPNTDITCQEPSIGPSRDPSLPTSTLGMTGMSKSFDERNPAHRPNGDWDYTQGAEASPARDLESHDIVVSTADDSFCKLSSISCHQEQDDKQGSNNEKDDIWADTFERVRRWRPSE